MNILIIQGHPDPESYNRALGEAYAKGARQSGHEVKALNISDLDFNPNLAYGYRKRSELEPDLLKAQEDILWCQHLVVVHPIWWGSVPALLKGFFDRVLLPGFAFQKHEGSISRWDKLLRGRSAHIICTADQPEFFYRLRYGQPNIRALHGLTFSFVGIRPVRKSFIGPVRLSSQAFRERHLRRVERAGVKGL